jgi:hypothetical protein
MQQPAIFLSLGLLLLASCRQNPAEKTAPDAVRAIPFTLTESNNISIPVILNQTDTLPMMLHTAARGVTVIAAISDQLKSIQWNGADSTQSWGGSNAARRSDHNTISVGNIHRDSVTIWETTNTGPGTEGKFGLDQFGESVIGINFSDSKLRLYPALPEDLSGYFAHDLRLDHGFMFLGAEVPMQDSTYSHEFLLHSGYAGTVLFDDAFAETAQLSSRLTITDQQELKDSYGNILLTQKATLPRFQIGRTELPGLTVGFFSGDIGRQKVSVMGGDLLKRFDWIFDFGEEKVWMKFRG